MSTGSILWVGVGVGGGGGRMCKWHLMMSQEL